MKRLILVTLLGLLMCIPQLVLGQVREVIGTGVIIKGSSNGQTEESAVV